MCPPYSPGHEVPSTIFNNVILKAERAGHKLWRGGPDTKVGENKAASDPDPFTFGKWQRDPGLDRLVPVKLPLTSTRIHGNPLIPQDHEHDPEVFG